MMTDDCQIQCDDHIVRFINVESLYDTPETNIVYLVYLNLKKHTLKKKTKERSKIAPAGVEFQPYKLDKMGNCKVILNLLSL